MLCRMSRIDSIPGKGPGNIAVGMDVHPRRDRSEE
jgi:hypothetical protein